MKRQAPRLIAGICISALFLWLVFRNANLAETAGIIAHARYWYLLPALAVYLLGIVIRVFRWGILLRPVKKIGFQGLFSTMVIGYMANNILPFRLGEVYRAYCLGRREKLSRSASLGTIVVERIFDGLTMVLFLVATTAFFVVSLPGEQKPYLLAAEAFFVAALGVALVFALRGDLLVAVAGWISRRLPGSRGALIDHIARSFAEGFASIARGRLFLAVAFLSLLSWSVEAVSYAITAAAFGIDLPWWGYWFVMALANLGGMIPAAPGFAGTFDKPGQVALTMLGVPLSAATAYILVLHYALLYLPVTLLGLFFAWRFNIRLALDPGGAGHD